MAHRESTDSRAQSAAKRRGIDLSQLCARQLTAEDFLTFDYVLGMDDDNLLGNACFLKPDESNAYVGLFLEFSGTPGAEVSDPYYGGEQGFEDVLDMIETASQGLIQHLKSDRV